MKNTRLASQKRTGSLPHAARYPQLVIALEPLGWFDKRCERV
jgi:hypothetical protein